MLSDNGYPTGLIQQSDEINDGYVSISELRTIGITLSFKITRSLMKNSINF